MKRDRYGFCALKYFSKKSYREKYFYSSILMLGFLS